MSSPILFKTVKFGNYEFIKHIVQGLNMLHAEQHTLGYRYFLGKIAFKLIKVIVKNTRYFSGQEWLKTDLCFRCLYEEVVDYHG